MDEGLSFREMDGGLSIREIDEVLLAIMQMDKDLSTMEIDEGLSFRGERLFAMEMDVGLSIIENLSINENTLRKYALSLYSSFSLLKISLNFSFNVKKYCQAQLIIDIPNSVKPIIIIIISKKPNKSFTFVK